MKFRKLVKYSVMAFIMVLMVDSLPPKGIGDDTVLFLNPSTNAPPPDVAILLDTSGSMTSLPCAVPDGEDACGVDANNSNKYFVNTLGYKPANDYGYSSTNPSCFDSNITPGGEGCFYGGTGAGLSTEGPLANSKTPSGSHVYINGYFGTVPNWCGYDPVTTKGPGGTLPSYWYDCGTITYSCYNEYSSTISRNNCINQLKNYGYWFYSGNYGYNVSLYTGNFLEFYPPKFVVTRKVMSDLITYNSNQYTTGKGVRFGIFSFNSNSDGAETDVKIYPPCNQLGSNPTPGKYLNTLYNLTWDHSTPLAGAVVQVGAYISNNNPWYNNLACNGNSYCGIPAGATLGTACKSSDDSWCGCDTIDFNPPITCEQNDVIVMTDGNENTGPGGLPNWPIGKYQISTAGESACSGAPGGSCNIDEVAGFLHNNSIRPPTQAACTTNIDTYTIGFAGVSGNGTALNTGALQRAANLGGGLFANAQNWQTMEKALYTFFANIIQKNRTFGTPNLPQIVTTGSASTSTTIPIFKSFIASFLPKNQNFWVGHLREYTGIAYTATGTIQLFDKNGIPFSGNTSAAGQCSYSEYVPPPIWDAGADLSLTTLTPCNPTLYGNTGYCYLAPDKRMIYTVTPALLSGFTSHTTGNGDTYWSAGIGGKMLAPAQQFTTSNTNLQASDFGVPDTPTMNSLISYIIGPKQDGIHVLGDIFHSNPTLVSTDALEQIDKYDDPTLIPTGSLGYKGYLTATYNMPQIVVAGADDGMIHAFYAGGYEPGTASFDGNVNYIPGTAQYDYGTGQEVWAFVPYDLLPKLQFMQNPALITTTTTGQYWTTEGIYTTTSSSHVYYVDASPYVRDVYLQGIPNNLPGVSGNAAYWHTIMIIGERLGGTYYICLDITNRLQPTFMWEFTTNNMGFTFGETQPQPPPMGPVYLNFNPSTGAAFTMPTPVWVALLSGGWDPINGTTGSTLTTNRGRAFYVVDIASGKLVWKYDRSIDSTMAYPTPASPVYIGPPNSTARWWIESFMSDLGGQLWQFSFMPQSGGAGSWGADQNTGSGLVRTCIAPWPADSNCWWANRTFAVQNPAPAQLQAQQFFYMPSASWDQCSVPNLWLGLAAGDRDNPLSCIPTDYLYEIMAPPSFANKFFTSSNLQLSNPATGVSNLPVCSTTFSPTGWYTSLSGFTGTAKGSKALSIPNSGGDIQYLSVFTPDQNACAMGSGGFSCNALGGTGVVAGFVMYPILGTGQNPGKLISFASTGSGIPSAPMAVTSIFGSSGQSTTSTTVTPPNPFSIATCGGGAGTSGVNTQMIVATSESGILNLGSISSYNMLLYPYYQICIPQNTEQGLVNPQNMWSPHRNYK